MTREEVFEKNKLILSKYLPEKSVDTICNWIFEYDFKLIIKGDRKSKWGDFKVNEAKRNYPIITINKTLNKYAFLITLVHEIAHCKTYKEYANKVESHGNEWKKNFQLLMQEFLNTDVFPIDLLYVLRQHMKNPTASATADVKLYRALMHYDETSNSYVLLECLNDGDKFIYNNEIFQRLKLVRKRIECVHIKTQKKYLFSPIVEVEWVE